MIDTLLWTELMVSTTEWLGAIEWLGKWLFRMKFFFFRSARIFECALQFSSKTFPWQKKSKQRGKRTRGTIPDLKRYSKKKVSRHTHVFITCPTSARINKGAENLKKWFSLVPPCCIHCAHLGILSLFFSETKCKTAEKKKFRGMFYSYIFLKAHAKILAL